MVNKTELKAIEYLISKGYKENEIIKNSNKSPDLICLDGKRFEVKFLYGNKLIFYSTQIKNLKEDDIILVFNKEELVKEFIWKDRENISFNIKIENVNNTKMIVGIDDELWRKFTSKCRYDGVKVAHRLSDLIKKEI